MAGNPLERGQLLTKNEQKCLVGNRTGIGNLSNTRAAIRKVHKKLPVIVWLFFNDLDLLFNSFDQRVRMQYEQEQKAKEQVVGGILRVLQHNPDVTNRLMQAVSQVPNLEKVKPTFDMAVNKQWEGPERIATILKKERRQTSLNILRAMVLLKKNTEEDVKKELTNQGFSKKDVTIKIKRLKTLAVIIKEKGILKLTSLGTRVCVITILHN